jgi:hypothetical protein
LIVFESCATGKKSVEVPEEPLYGTWVNPEYDELEDWSAKFVFNPDHNTYRESGKSEEEYLIWKIGSLDGSYAQYWRISDKEPLTCPPKTGPDVMLVSGVKTS